ncbi:MAG: hypothetical protein AAGA90_20435 [Actinomycetota bacterium]
MALRDKVRDRIQPSLEPGEEVHAVFLAQTGPNPLWILVTWLVLLFGTKYRIVAVTTKGTRVWSASMWMPAKPKEPLSLYAHAPLTAHSGLWKRIAVNGEEMWVHKRFAKDVDAAILAIARA